MYADHIYIYFYRTVLYRVHAHKKIKRSKRTDRKNRPESKARTFNKGAPAVVDAERGACRLTAYNAKRFKIP